jgi:hypothetical protein
MELWASIPGYEGFYEVSNFGRVRSMTRQVSYGRHPKMTYKGRDLKLFMAGQYAAVKLAVQGVTRTQYVHHLVLLAFKGPRPHTESRGEIRHLDGDKMNNSLFNLEYGTIQENAADRIRHKAARK